MADSDYDAVALVATPAESADAVPPEPPAPEVVELPVVPELPGPEAPPALDTAKPTRSRPRWAVPAAIAAIGLIASGSLGYLYYTTSNKLDATRHQLFVTQSGLDQTTKTLAAADADAANKKVTADYMKMYTQYAGKVHSDYGELFACDTYASCRFAAQQALTDMQAFQAARQSATVPSDLSDSDSALGDSLSAGIAAIQEVIDAMDTNNRTKLDDGYNKLDAAMLSMGKAEASLGGELQ